MTTTAHRHKSSFKKACIGLFAGVVFFIFPNAASAAYLYPDLLTLPPSELQFDSVEQEGRFTNVLRFTNAVWNAGDGPLEMYGTTTPEGQTQVTQRIYDDEGGYTENTSGNFVWHPAHNHWHFEKFAQYQLFTKDDYDTWVQNGENPEDVANVGYKTTFCIRETEMIEEFEGTPTDPIHTECGAETQGLSPGWGDSYRYNLPEQWIEIGDSTLQDGDYVLRSVADPDNLIQESPDEDPYYESHRDNEAVTHFSVHEGEIFTDTEPE